MTRIEPSWPQARASAHAAAAPLAVEELPLVACIGSVLAHPLIALHPSPPFDTSMMDGWAVAGRGPWRIVGTILAGSVGGPLVAATATVIATGARVPDGATAVLRSEHGSLGPEGLLRAAEALADGRDIRRRGEECDQGEVLLPAGTLVTPPVAGLAASAGHDALAVHRRAAVDTLVLGDELLDAGLPRDGRIRDSLSPQVPAWARAAGATAIGAVRVPDTLAATVAALEGSGADVILTTGGTARGPVDHLHAALSAVGAELLVDSVAVRPGHPMLLAQLPDNRFVAGLPGNPMAAAAAFCTLVVPVLEAFAARPLPALGRRVLTDPVSAPEREHRLIPGVIDGETISPLPHQGSAMLRGLAQADGFIVSPPGGAAAGAGVDVLSLPWK